MHFVTYKLNHPQWPEFLAVYDPEAPWAGSAAAGLYFPMINVAAPNRLFSLLHVPHPEAPTSPLPDQPVFAAVVEESREQILATLDGLPVTDIVIREGVLTWT